MCVCAGDGSYRRYEFPLNPYWPTRQLVPFSRMLDIGIRFCIGEGGREGRTAYRIVEVDGVEDVVERDERMAYSEIRYTYA